MKKWKQLQLTLNNSKSEERRGDYLDIKEFKFLDVIFMGFAQKVPVM